MEYRLDFNRYLSSVVKFVGFNMDRCGLKSDLEVLDKSCIVKVLCPLMNI